MIYRLIVFLALNFGLLALGSFLADGGSTSEWYAQLKKAPWTPPGWVFGGAWTTIMICFSIYMAMAYQRVKNRQKLLFLFGLQWVLNATWNPLFFGQQIFTWATVILVLLTLVIAYFQFGLRASMKSKSWLVTPYLVWLILATSLNLYIIAYN